MIKWGNIDNSSELMKSLKQILRGNANDATWAQNMEQTASLFNNVQLKRNWIFERAAGFSLLFFFSILQKTKYQPAICPCLHLYIVYSFIIYNQEDGARLYPISFALSSPDFSLSLAVCKCLLVYFLSLCCYIVCMNNNVSKPITDLFPFEIVLMMVKI